MWMNGGLSKLTRPRLSWLRPLPSSSAITCHEKLVCVCVLAPQSSGAPPQMEGRSAKERTALPSLGMRMEGCVGRLFWTMMGNIE